MRRVLPQGVVIGLPERLPGNPPPPGTLIEVSPRDSLLEIATPIPGDPSISRAGFAFTKPKEVTGGVPAPDLRML
ncbi:hypothetical protein MDA_GLEAN10004103 [Myotis davidii]|uniref:Uncharacterized protein n=1 Tax=Myotis davidii TaxID=225400 RepID=L5M299_MYODS|nr:hypothetical protein MDA_GLEAN10004103 [Myotis davidii]